MSDRSSSRGAGFSIHLKIGKGLFFLFALCILFSGITFMHTFASSGESVPPANGEQVVSVDSGDTLWELAKSYKNPTIDTRQAVHAILARNGMSSSDLTSGQEIIIPTNILP